MRRSFLPVVVLLIVWYQMYSVIECSAWLGPRTDKGWCTMRLPVPLGVRFGRLFAHPGDRACVDAQSCRPLGIGGWHSAGASLWPCTVGAQLQVGIACLDACSYLRVCHPAAVLMLTIGLSIVNVLAAASFANARGVFRIMQRGVQFHQRMYSAYVQ